MTKQEQLDQAVSGLTASAENIAADLTTLKEQIASGTVTDESLSNLDKLVRAFAEIAASTPDAEVTNPPEESSTEPQA